jgi:hypothetical protein
MRVPAIFLGRTSALIKQRGGLLRSDDLSRPVGQHAHSVCYLEDGVVALGVLLVGTIERSPLLPLSGTGRHPVPPGTSHSASTKRMGSDPEASPIGRSKR